MDGMMDIYHQGEIFQLLIFFLYLPNIREGK